MRRLVYTLLLVLLCNVVYGKPVSHERAYQAAIKALSVYNFEPNTLEYFQSIDFNGEALAHLYHLSPEGFALVSADDELPVLLAYSKEGSITRGTEETEKWTQFVAHNYGQRLINQSNADKAGARDSWNVDIPRDEVIHYPPEGYSPTGGWLRSNWTQSYPYNMYVPKDPVTNTRSVAGCPSVAMGMIVNYYETINGIAFDDSDDYYHNLQGRTFWVDDDFQTHGFASFPQLNTYLSDLMYHYKYQEPITNSDKGALVWACGIACTQVYTSQVSGTYSVNQAWQAYQRFAFEGMELLTEPNPALFSRMAQNMMDAKPVHLALVTPSWDSGHNVVVDGYNTDDYFHLNFGWGGSFNGWYLLFSEIPYNLTMLEGVIVDISPKSYLITVPEQVDVLNIEDIFEPIYVEVINISNSDLLIEGLDFPPFIGASRWEVCFDPPLQNNLIPDGQSAFIKITVDLPVRSDREIIHKDLRIIHTNGVTKIPVSFDTSLITSNEDQVQNPNPINLVTYPNPFKESITVSSDFKSINSEELNIYNMRGQLIRSINSTLQGSFIWDGKMDNKQSAPCGIYLMRLKHDKGFSTKRVLKI